MGEHDERFIEVPVWFLKLLGWVAAGCLGLFVSWATWITIAMVEIEQQIGAAAELKARVGFLEKEVVEIKLALARLRNE